MVKTKHIGTVGILGQGTGAIVLRTYNTDTKQHGRQWFTFDTVEMLGLMKVPVSEIVVRVQEKGFLRI